MSDLSKKLWQLSLDANLYTPATISIELQDLSAEAKEQQKQIDKLNKVVEAVKKYKSVCRWDKNKTLYSKQLNEALAELKR